MTLQERMIQAYLRQSELPQSEKEKLKLFLVLLDETYREESEETASREGKSENQTPPAKIRRHRRQMTLSPEAC